MVLLYDTLSYCGLQLYELIIGIGDALLIHRRLEIALNPYFFLYGFLMMKY